MHSQWSGSLERTSQCHQELPDNIDLIDLCIIATSSNVRLTVLKKVVSKYSIKNLILEKVLFQSIRELDEAKDLINKEKIKCWINCPRREETFWRDMKKILSCYSGLNLYYGKSDWSMCCNSIHIIDLAVWLFNDKIRHLDNSNLNNDIHKSKREGFIEMTGILKCYFERDNTCTLEANVGIPREEATFEISGDEIRLIVNEYKGKGILYKKENNWIPQEYDFHIPFQSGDNEVLKRMGRGYKIEKYKRIIDNIRELMPNASISADAIVAFPGESEHQFQKTLKVINDIGYFWGGARSDFFDGGDPVFFVAGVNSLWTVATIKVFIEGEA